MRHLPLQAEMVLHGRRDLAGRLLTADQRHAAAPDHEYWQRRAEDAGRRLIARIGEAGYNEFVDSQPDDITWMGMALAIDRRLAQPSQG